MVRLEFSPNSMHKGYRSAALSWRKRHLPGLAARITRLMKQAGLKVPCKRKFHTTINSKHRHKVAENLLERRGPRGCRFRQDSAPLQRNHPTKSGLPM